MKLLLFLSLNVIFLFSFYTVESGYTYKIDHIKYYTSYPTNANWYEAWEFCAYNAMYLIDIRTYFEQERINEVIDQLKKDVSDLPTDLKFWTSGTKNGHDSFYWITSGQPIVWTNWGNGWPVTEDDSCMYGSLNWSNKWRHWNCTDNKITFICRETLSFPVLFEPAEDKDASNGMRRRKIKKHSRKHKSST